MSYLLNLRNVLTSRWTLIGCGIAGTIALFFPATTLALTPIAAACLWIFWRWFALTFQIPRQEEKIKKLKIKLSEAEKALKEAVKIYEDCLKTLKQCAGCQEKFKPKCIKTCKGCGRDYCNNCFDAGIEAWELRKANV